MGLGWGRPRVRFWTRHMERPDLLEQLGHLFEVEPFVNGTVDTVHGQWLVGSQDIWVTEIWLNEDEGVAARLSPQFHEVDRVSEAQRGVSGEHHARLAELAAEVSVDAGVVLQLVGLDQLKQQQQQHRSC